MLKSVSSITNAIGALNFQGTWNASTNSPALASSVGTKGDYYVVGTAGSTNLNGISNWGVGDLATFNGSVWQRVEGGADLNGVNLSVSGTSTLSGLTASTALALNASKEIVSVTNTGTGDNVLATAPTLVGNVTFSTGNLVIGTSDKGIDFSATAGTGTSELLADYEEGTFSPTLTTDGVDFTSVTYSSERGAKYIKVGSVVHFQLTVRTTAVTVGSASGNVLIEGLPFTATASSTGQNGNSVCVGGVSVSWTVANPVFGVVQNNSTNILLYIGQAAVTATVTNVGTGAGANYLQLTGTYVAA